MIGSASLRVWDGAEDGTGGIKDYDTDDSGSDAGDACDSPAAAEAAPATVPILAPPVFDDTAPVLEPQVIKLV